MSECPRKNQGVSDGSKGNIVGHFIIWGKVEKPKEQVSDAVHSLLHEESVHENIRSQD
jgi:hypothetical protein